MNNYALTPTEMPLVSSFDAYRSYVNRLPILPENEEKELVQKFKQENCLEAAQKLILSQLKTVLNVAQQHKGYGLPQEDLVQEGNIGLMKAVKNFDLKYNVRLYTYALIWIRAEIQTFILKNWKIVKIATTKNLKKLFFNFKTVQKELMDFGVSKKELIQHLAKKLNVTEAEAREMQLYFSADDVSVESENEDQKVFELPDYATPESIFEQKHDKLAMEESLQTQFSKLTPKQKQVIEMRFLLEEKKTHKEIAQVLNVSSERVRQIEQEALNKLKKLLT